ncbi:MAG: hypothetical protein QY302_17645 [Anaerolineales bacterium]|nr:MAG: hypothetical protein QY302_17645 [Anaerolineales bacterium]
MFPKLIFLVMAIALLAACAAPAQQTSEVSETSEVSTATPAPTETPTFTPTSTSEPTATTEPYDLEAEYAKQTAIIENAVNNEVDFAYLNSPEYLKSLHEKNAKGEFPKISPEAVYVEAGTIDLNYKDLEENPSNVFLKYGGDNAILFTKAWKWKLREYRPYAVVDAGVSKIGESEIGFYVLKWKNFDGSEAFWGYIFLRPKNDTLTNTFLDRINRKGGGYPSIAYWRSPDFCNNLESYIYGNHSDYCNLISNNPHSAVPKDILSEWNKTGILKMDFLPISQSLPRLLP